MTKTLLTYASVNPSTLEIKLASEIINVSTKVDAVEAMREIVIAHAEWLQEFGYAVDYTIRDVMCEMTAVADDDTIIRKYELKPIH